MTLKEKLNWVGELDLRLRDIQKDRFELASGKAERASYYFFVGSAVYCAIELYVEGDTAKLKPAFQTVVDAVLAYFYGDWRSKQKTPNGTTGHEAWKPYCLWYDEVQQTLPFAAALSDWAAMKRIAEYPPKDKLPEAAKARGETAWGWALVMFLRGEPRSRVEAFLAKVQSDKAKRPQLLAPVLRALMDNDSARYRVTLLDYLAYYRKKEFKRHLTKLVTLEGTTLFHLGRKQGYHIEMPQDYADHILCLHESGVACQPRSNGEQTGCTERRDRVSVDNRTSVARRR